MWGTPWCSGCGTALQTGRSRDRIVPKIAGSLPTEAVGFFRLEKFTACLPSEWKVKIICPMLVTRTKLKVNTVKTDNYGTKKKNPDGVIGIFH
jgi:hypothetical protein